ncbi:MULTISPECIES: hypothetical protein [Nitrosomonas]|uniref:hypothetical protein n=1 Tax=Nitrosomonas TaxID=914 RepID=UPI0011874FFB|nr:MULTISPECIES: hypothetical protein [Nitrosomonas]UVS60001.1 hypothetical protein NX761_10645 [Nitrosomonas sp. PLL12]
MIQSLLAKKNLCGVSLFIRTMTMIPVGECESSSEVTLGLSGTRSALSSALGPPSAHGMTTTSYARPATVLQRPTMCVPGGSLRPTSPCNSDGQGRGNRRPPYWLVW